MRLLRAPLPCIIFCLSAVFLISGCSLWSKKTPPTVPAASTTNATATVTDTNRLRFDPLRVGDSIRIEFSGTPTSVPSVQTEVKGDGTIRLDFIGNIVAEGLTPGELEHAIQTNYVPDYYTHLSVSVTPVVRYFYVEGEINMGATGRLPYTGQITVTRAIAAAGGFSPFASRRNVRLYRVDGNMKTINCVKALDDPKLDLQVYPGDKIVVRRRYW